MHVASCGCLCYCLCGFADGLFLTFSHVVQPSLQVGLDGWVSYFQQHLPEKVKSIADLRSTKQADMNRMGKSANMRLDVKTSRSVLMCVPPAQAEHSLTSNQLV